MFILSLTLLLGLNFRIVSVMNHGSWVENPADFPSLNDFWAAASPNYRIMLTEGPAAVMAAIAPDAGSMNQTFGYMQYDYSSAALPTVFRSVFMLSTPLCHGWTYTTNMLAVPLDEQLDSGLLGQALQVGTQAAPGVVALD